MKVYYKNITPAAKLPTICKLRIVFVLGGMYKYGPSNLIIKYAFNDADSDYETPCLS